MNYSIEWTDLLGLSLAIQMVRTRSKWYIPWLGTHFLWIASMPSSNAWSFHFPLLFVNESTKHVAYFYWTLSSIFNHQLEIFNFPIDHCGSISTIDPTIENFQLFANFFSIIALKISIITQKNYSIVVIESCFNCYMDYVHIILNMEWFFLLYS